MAANQLITEQGLVVHQYHDTELLGATLPSAAGTAEAQAHFITGMLRAYQITRRDDILPVVESALAALLDFVFRDTGVPSIVTLTDSFTPNVAVAAKSPFNSATIHYTPTYTFVNGEVVIPSSSVHIVFRAMSLDAVLAFQNPYAPLLVGTDYPVESYRYEPSGGVRVKLVTPYNGTLIVVFSTKDGGLIDRTNVFDYWPDWKSLGESQVVTHGQLYSAVHDAFIMANAIFGGDTWAKAAIATRQQAVLAATFTDTSPYSGGIFPGVINFGSRPLSLLGRRGPAYSGMQTPALMMVQSNLPAAVNGSALLRDAQAQWKIQTGQPNTGPFAPVYHLQSEGMIQYGTPGTFDWAGPDERLSWGEFQYRPLNDLLVLAARTTDATLKAESLATATNLLAWLAQDNIWLPMWAPYSDAYADYIERACAFDWKPFSDAHINQYAQLINKAVALAYTEAQLVPPLLDAQTRYTSPLYGVPIVFPDRPPLGPPTDFPRAAAEINRPDPHLAAMILLAVTRLDALQRPAFDATGPMNVILRAVMSKAMAQLREMYISDGEMAGTFSPDPANRVWYGAWHGDMLEAFSLTAAWASTTQADRSSIRALMLEWLNGMIEFVDRNSSVDPDAQHFPWPFPHNWRVPLTESFEWATSVFSSFQGKEQRLSLRTAPRRSLGYTHTLKGDDARGYDAILRAKQNEMISVPQWHLAVNLTADVPAGQSYLLVDEVPVGVFRPGDFVGFGEGSDLQFGVVSAVVGLRVELTAGVATAVPASAKLVSTDSGLISPSQSSTRRTSTVLESQVSFDIAPQEDRRPIPDVAAPMTFTVGTDTREVILTKPNWRDAITVGNAWTYTSTADYVSGPVRPINGEDHGRRTITGTWSLRNRTQINAYLGLLKRLHGRRYAAWLPSWTSDLTPSRTSGLTDRLYVHGNPHTELGVFSDPTVALLVEMRDGTIYTARVALVIPNEIDVQLRLDRSLPAVVDISQIKVISLMYRVRQMSDTATLRWRTNRVAETSVAFISVSDEP
jgi:hypothetical protein